MSYSIYEKEQNFRIPADKKKDAFMALLAAGLATRCNISTLEEALNDAGWIPTLVPTGDIVEVRLAQDEINDALQDTLDALAPFVDAGSYLEFEGEDGYRWRWVFNGKELDKIDQPITDWKPAQLIHTGDTEYTLVPDTEKVTINVLGAKITVTKYNSANMNGADSAINIDTSDGRVLEVFYKRMVE